MKDENKHDRLSITLTNLLCIYRKNGPSLLRAGVSRNVLKSMPPSWCPKDETVTTRTLLPELLTVDSNIGNKSRVK